MAELTIEEARFAASTNAAAFMASLGLEDFKTFAWRAQARRLAVASTPLFAEDGFVPGIEPEGQEEFRNTRGPGPPPRAGGRRGLDAVESRCGRLHLRAGPRTCGG